MFSGEYRHAIDEKGRVTVPRKYRDFFKDGVAVVPGEDGCLYVYPRAEWLERHNKLRNLPTNEPKVRAFVRLVLSGLHEDELDKQWRIFIPPRLREHASLDREVTIVGSLGRLEIWDEAAWQAYRERYMPSFTEIAESSGLGL